MGKKDYYEILGVGRNSDPRKIKQAYRQLAMELHPDRNPQNPQAEELFKEAAEAFAVLSSPEKREIYDRFGHEGLRGQTGFSAVEDIFSSFGDIFSEFFGGDLFGARRRSRPPRPARGADLRYDLNVSFEDALRGTKKKIELNQLRRCQDCDGVGAAAGTQPEVCFACAGHGQVTQHTGFMTLSTTCPSCHGRGAVISTPCSGCDGTGRAPFKRAVTANVPAGVDTGMRLRLAGEGEHPESGGEPGDLYIYIEVEPHPEFRRSGNNLICEVSVPYTRAILGHRVEIELVDEQVAVDLPPGTQPGSTIPVAGKGVPYVSRPGAGDLIVKVKVELPTTVTEKESELLNALEALASSD